MQPGKFSDHFLAAVVAAAADTEVNWFYPHQVSCGFQLLISPTASVAVRLPAADLVVASFFLPALFSLAVLFISFPPLAFLRMAITGPSRSRPTPCCCSVIHAAFDVASVDSNVPISRAVFRLTISAIYSDYLAVRHLRKSALQCSRHFTELGKSVV